MWVRFINNYNGNKIGDIIYVEYDDGIGMIDTDIARRCTGPDGISFEEATPEAVALNISTDIEDVGKVELRKTLAESGDKVTLDENGELVAIKGKIGKVGVSKLSDDLTQRIDDAVTEHASKVKYRQCYFF